MIDLNLVIEGAFSFPYTGLSTDSSAFLTDYSEHQEAGKFLICNLKNLTDIPICMLPVLLANNAQVIRRNMYDTAAFPLYFSDVVFARNSEKIFRYFSYSNRLTKVITNKGLVFYLGKGIILDSNMSPLILITCHVTNVSPVRDHIYLNVNKITIRVSPNVLMSDDLLSKLLRKKVLPIFIWKRLRFYDVNIFTEESMSSEVTVENLDKFIIEPEKLETSTRISETPEEFLQKEDVVEEIIANI